jgi:hypothetical protein
MAGKIQMRRDTAANWTSVNPILASGEIGLETDTDLFKVGNGVTTWSSRTYGGIQGDAGINTIPSSGADKTTAYTLTTDDVGNFVSVGSGGSITLPASVFSAGDVVTLYNDTGGDIAVNCSAVTSYVVGINTNITSALLSTRGLCTVMFVAPAKCILGGTIT